MNTPIFDFVTQYIKQNMTRLHMPGHKGVPNLGCEDRDITEIAGADELYAPKGIILESEQNVAELFGTKKTLYSAGGSSQSINAMLFTAYTAAPKTNNRPFILAARNVHKAFIYAAAKLDIDVEWLYGEEKNICSCTVTPDALENRLKNLKAKPFAVYVTSPDYLGKMCDIKGLSAVCKKHKIPLLVDNAHGAYLAFLNKNQHPIALGADICCDSAHKTLPVLTGGGYLHIAKDDLYGFSGYALRATEMFGSTSPSYLILQSLDLCNRYICDNIRQDLNRIIPLADKIRAALKLKGIEDVSDEPLKITADFSKLTVNNGSPDRYFRNMGIECEYSDGDYVVFMLTPNNSNEDFEKLYTAVSELKLVLKTPKTQARLARAEQKLSIRQAIFSKAEEIEVKNALGRICAAPTVSCPPAIPIALSGEVINQSHIKLFENYGIKKIAVVKN